MLDISNYNWPRLNPSELEKKDVSSYYKQLHFHITYLGNNKLLLQMFK